MKLKVLIFTVFSIIILSCTPGEHGDANSGTEQVFLVDYVNPLMGTDSEFTCQMAIPILPLHSLGDEFLDPNDPEMGDGWTYKYHDNKIRGIKQTHQPSPWINDYAAFSLMAVTGELKI